MKDLDRRQLLHRASLLGGGFASTTLPPSWARGATAGLAPSLPTLAGADIDLTISHSHLAVDGRQGRVVTINGTVPGPLLRLREGQTVRLSVRNALTEDTSIHWHGVLVPFQMDGVPGVTFPGIKPGQTFVYEFPIVQSGTYRHDHADASRQAGGAVRPPSPARSRAKTGDDIVAGAVARRRTSEPRHGPDARRGLRLRYELSREFAPYVGLSYDRKLGRTADFARARGGGTWRRNRRHGNPRMVLIRPTVGGASV